ncbi:MAG: S8 family peptidase [Lachnospiraceae bacterium]|nr:S8 family peptidase [Lachnospiraceae bacterium]
MSAPAKIPAQFFNAIPFHRQGITGKNITVAVMDSGISPHPDIHPSRILAFEDFVEVSPHASNSRFSRYDHPLRQTPSAAFYDDFSHGTHVAGIIASDKIGIAPECNLVSLKVLDHHGNGSSGQFVEALKWLLLHQNIYNIRILNISIGGSQAHLKDENAPLNLWVNKLWENGITVCCSAGNNGPSPDSITAPGNCKKVITVGSSDGKRYSSAGPLLPYITKPELVAPGTHVLSLKPGGGYHIKSGTSMSVPFISGACALLLQLYPHLTNDQIKIRLMEAARTVPYLPYNMQGAGVLSLQKLLYH